MMIEQKTLILHRFKVADYDLKNLNNILKEQYYFY